MFHCMTGRWDWLGWYPEVAGAYSRRQGPPAPQPKVLSVLSGATTTTASATSSLRSPAVVPGPVIIRQSSPLLLRQGQARALNSPHQSADRTVTSHLTPHHQHQHHPHMLTLTTDIQIIASFLLPSFIWIRIKEQIVSWLASAAVTGFF